MIKEIKIVLLALMWSLMLWVPLALTARGGVQVTRSVVVEVLCPAVFDTSEKYVIGRDSTPPFIIVPGLGKVYNVVEESPRFPGCEHLPDSKQRIRCADKKWYEFAAANTRYPDLARVNKVEGSAAISFIVTSKGGIINAGIIRDPGAEIGNEALRVVELMKEMPERWIPAKHNGVAVNAFYVLMLKFKLSN